MADLIEADSEPGFCEIAMGLLLGPAGAEEAQRGARGPGEGAGDETHEQVELARVGEAGDGSAGLHYE